MNYYKFWLWIARRLPKKLRYWTFMSEIARLTHEGEEGLTVTVDTMLRRL